KERLYLKTFQLTYEDHTAVSIVVLMDDRIPHTPIPLKCHSGRSCFSSREHILDTAFSEVGKAPPEKLFCNARSSMLRKNTDFILVCQRCMAERPSQHHGKSVGVDLLFDAFRQHWVPDRKPNNRTTQNSHPARCDIRYFCAY